MPRDVSGKGPAALVAPDPDPPARLSEGAAGASSRMADEQGDSETGNRANRVHDVLGIDLVARPIEQGMDAMDAPERGYPPLLGGEDER
jgi:hypothetical protein